MRSMKVEAPSVVASNRTVVVVRKLVGPVVRSRVTSYVSTDSRSARSRASSRVRFLPGTGGLLDGAQVGGHVILARGPEPVRATVVAPCAPAEEGWQDGARD